MPSNCLESGSLLIPYRDLRPLAFGMYAEGPLADPRSRKTSVIFDLALVGQFSKCNTLSRASCVALAKGVY